MPPTEISCSRDHLTSEEIRLVLTLTARLDAMAKQLAHLHVEATSVREAIVTLARSMSAAR